MARARNIKPGFFRNSDLVELDFETRLLFIGLWTLADRQGRLEDRPKQIKMELFPADNVDCDLMLNSLSSIGVIVRYEVDGKRYIEVTNFLKHQNPHRDERCSTIPDQLGNFEIPKKINEESPKTLCKHHANTVQAPCNDDGNPVVIVLNPESGFLNPDVLNPDSFVPQDKPAKPAKRKTQIDDNFYPNETGLENAHKAGIDVGTEVEAFLNHHKANGSVMADWQAAWRTWVAKSVKFSKSRKPSESFKERDERNARKRWEEMTGQIHPDNLTYVDQPSLMLGMAA